MDVLTILRFVSWPNILYYPNFIISFLIYDFFSIYWFFEILFITNKDIITNHILMIATYYGYQKNYRKVFNYNVSGLQDRVTIIEVYINLSLVFWYMITTYILDHQKKMKITW